VGSNGNELSLSLWAEGKMGLEDAFSGLVDEEVLNFNVTLL
jgi:hypothetical protein